MMDIVVNAVMETAMSNVCYGGGSGYGYEEGYGGYEGGCGGYGEGG